MSDASTTTVAPQVLLMNHFKALKLPTFAREYEKVGVECANEGVDYARYLLRLCELERIDRERRNTERRIRMAKFPVIKSLDTFVHELMEARDEKRLRLLHKQLANTKLLIIDELGYVPFTAVGAELLFEVFSRRYEHGATLVTSNLPFDEWTNVLGSERLTGALLDRLIHHVNILEMNGESYRLAASKKRQKQSMKSGLTEKENDKSK